FGWGQASILPDIMDNVSSLEAMIEAAKRQGADQGEFFGMYYTDILPYARKWQEQNSGKITDYRMARPYVDDNNVGDYYLNPNGTGFLPYADYDINKIMLNNAAPSQQHNVSLSGSTGKAVYDLSFGYSERQSLVNFNPDKVRRYNAKANLSLDLFKWLQAGVRINFTKRQFETPNVGSNTWGTIWRFPGFYQMLGWRPDSEGTPYDFQNQIAYLKQADMEDINSTFTRLQAWAKATIIPGLTVNADFTYSIYNRNEEYAYLPVISWPSWGRTLSAPTYRVSQASTTATKANTNNTRWTFNAYGTYDLTVADHNNFKIMLGTNIEQNTYGWFQARTKVLLDNNLPALNLYNGDLVAPGNEDNHWATAGFFGRFNYDYKGIYLAEFNGRYDGSSR
ncbi:MAG: SusC/RagA family protein, partial [Muribaculaceae bacterium]|nr:SusC/RagA family protein [Muribaculaceae bacterium]